MSVLRRRCRSPRAKTQRTQAAVLVYLLSAVRPGEARRASLRPAEAEVT